MKWLVALLLAIAPASAQVVTTPLVRPVLLFQSTAVVGNGADTTEDTLYTVTIPAGTLANVGDVLHVIARGTAAATTDSKSTRLKFGGTNINSFTQNAVGNVAWYFEVWILKTGANAQSITAFTIPATNNVTSGIGTSAITDTGAITMLLTGQNSTAATANSIQTSSMFVYYLPGT